MRNFLHHPNPSTDLTKRIVTVLVPVLVSILAQISVPTKIFAIYLFIYLEVKKNRSDYGNFFSSVLSSRNSH